MQFNTEYNKGDHCWIMKNNKPTEIIISAIEIFYVGTNQDRISYSAIDAKDPKTWLDYTNIQEYDIFETKQDLLDCL